MLQRVSALPNPLRTVAAWGSSVASQFRFLALRANETRPLDSGFVWGVGVVGVGGFSNAEFGGEL